MRRFLGWIILSTAPWVIPLIEQFKFKVRLEMNWAATREILRVRRLKTKWSYLENEQDGQGSYTGAGLNRQ